LIKSSSAVLLVALTMMSSNSIDAENAGISVFVASFVLISAFGHDDSIDGLIAYTIVNMVTNILGIPLALLNIKIVKDYSKIEPLLREVNDDEETIANIIV